jgi:hypothetical protein
MKRETLQQWAKRFVADLCIDGEDVSFDGTIRKHGETILRFRAERLKAKSVLRAITQAGGRREDGQPYSEGQFRIAVSRVKREIKGSVAANASAELAQSRRRPSAVRRPKKTRPAPQQGLPDQKYRLSTTLDLSANEITSALSRLKTHK